MNSSSAQTEGGYGHAMWRKAGGVQIFMIADCDLRTGKLIEREVRQELVRQYGSVIELTLFKIEHERERVVVQGEFTAKPGEEEKRFAMVMPRVDGPLDYFL